MEILCKSTVTNIFEVSAYRMHEFVNPLKDKEEEISGGRRSQVVSALSYVEGGLEARSTDGKVDRVGL